MDKNLSASLIWEAYKHLSRNALSDKELDLYYFLTNYYLEKTTEPFSDSLYELISRAINEEIIEQEENIKGCIEKLYTKKSLY